MPDWRIIQDDQNGLYTGLLEKQKEILLNCIYKISSSASGYSHMDERDLIENLKSISYYCRQALDHD